jgi:hypothetical protein
MVKQPPDINGVAMMYKVNSWKRPEVIRYRFALVESDHPVLMNAGCELLEKKVLVY